MQKELASEDEMKAWGEKIGASLRGGECIELVGDVGSGKTTLTKGIALGLGITETVQSPTFTINRTYQSPHSIILSHYDFYRLSDAGIMAEELDESVNDSSTVVVVEWGEIVTAVLPEDHLRITFDSPSEESRIVTVEAYGESSKRLQEAIV